MQQYNILITYNKKVMYLGNVVCKRRFSVAIT